MFDSIPEPIPRERFAAIEERSFAFLKMTTSRQAAQSGASLLGASGGGMREFPPAPGCRKAGLARRRA
jgi:hypothetical protein